MIFDVEMKARLTKFLFTVRKMGLLLNVVAVLAMTLHSQNASAGKLKLAVFPVNDTMDLKKHQRDYLYDVIREAASASAGSYLSLIHQQKIKGAIKKNKGACGEDCALKSATSMDARVALVVEMHEHGAQILGVVKLLDTKENVLLTVKRFFADTLTGAEQELQGAVMFVLSAQFLPIEDNERRALQIEQQNVPVNYARPGKDASPLQTSPSTPVAPANNEEANTTPGPSDYSYSNTDIAEPSEPRDPKVYLVTAIVTGVIGIGSMVASGVFGGQAVKEQRKWDDEKDLRDELVGDYNWVTSGDMEEGQFNLKYQTRLGLTSTEFSYANDAQVQSQIDLYSGNLDIINDAIKLNGILAASFGVIAVPATIVSAVFTVKYIRARKSQTAMKLRVTPVLTPQLSGAFLSGSF